MSFEVLVPGLQTTVQDLGRPGFGHLGVSMSGAADSVALRLGNRVVGNPESAAALEMTLSGATLRFERAGWVALTGAAFEVRLDGVAVEPWRALPIVAGQVLAIGSAALGARSYLAVRGGITVPPVLGSASTHVQSELGGYHGRALRRGDRLGFGGAAAVLEPVAGPTAGATLEAWEPRRVSAAARARLAPRRTLRVVRGTDAPEFGAEAWSTLLAAEYRVSDRSNRMGLRLEGAVLGLAQPREFLTEGAPLGAIQVPPDGRPIVLFVEHQTTGGYPKIANVIAADMPSLGQLRPRDAVRFSLVTLEDARAALLEQEELVRSPATFEP